MGGAVGAGSNAVGSALTSSTASNQIIQFAASNKVATAAAKKAAGKSAGSLVPGC
jgi:hypothetical protein